MAALGIDVSGDEPGEYGSATASAVRTLQERRGLPADGVCDATTWAVLVEAGYRLGARPLYRTSPMLRGDDVAELQRRLNALGFDAGRVDGIFGAQSEQALIDFQRNAGLVTDSICGPATIAELQRLSHLCDGPASFATLRERERLRRGARSLANRIVVIGHPGGAGALATAVSRSVAAAGGRGLVVEHPDGSEQAAQANTADADVFVGMSLAGGAQSTLSYYRSAASGWESVEGERLAHLLADRFEPLLGHRPAVQGMGLPVLRETRMPAVVMLLAPPSTVVERTAELGSAAAAVLDEWVSAAIDA